MLLKILCIVDEEADFQVKMGKSALMLEVKRTFVHSVSRSEGKKRIC